MFDVYEGKGVPEGKKSLAISVRLQPKDKTLTDAEIEAVAAEDRRRGDEGDRRHAQDLNPPHSCHLAPRQAFGQSREHMDRRGS